MKKTHIQIYNQFPCASSSVFLHIRKRKQKHFLKGKELLRMDRGMHVCRKEERETKSLNTSSGGGLVPAATTSVFPQIAGEIEFIRVPSSTSRGGTCFNLSTQERQRQEISVSSRPAWSTKTSSSHNYPVRPCLKTKEESLLPGATNQSLSTKTHRNVFLYP